MSSIAKASRFAPDTADRDAVTGFLARVAEGDRVAFRALYEKTAPRLHAICLRVLRDRSAAEDVLQEIYVRIWERARQFDAARGNGLAWVISIARNSAIDSVRARGRNKAVADLDAIEVADEESTRALESTLETTVLRRCLDGLDETARRAIVLAYREGLTYDELAGILDVPPNTVKTWVRRGILKLRDCMDGDDGQ